MKRGKSQGLKRIRSEYIDLEVSQKTPTRSDDELRADYLATYAKYALQKVYIAHPDTMPIFEKVSGD